MSGVNELTSQLAIATTRGAQVVSDAVRAAVADLRAAAPEYAREAEGVAERVAGFVAKGISGELDSATAIECATRETDAIELIILTAKEVAAQAAARRVKATIDAVIDIAAKFAQVAATVAVSAAKAGI